MVEEEQFEPTQQRGPGVDLGNVAQRELIERIFWSRWARQVEAAGLDPDDVLQRVFMGMLTRNRGKRPFDPRTSSLSNYSWWVIRSVVRNSVDQRRRASNRDWNLGGAHDAALDRQEVPEWACVLGVQPHR